MVLGRHASRWGVTPHMVQCHHGQAHLLEQGLQELTVEVCAV